MAALSSNDAQKFAEELQWCVNQLETGLQRQSPDSRQAIETIKVLKILRSTKAPMVKKRQAMRNALGDYRKKMKEAEKKSISGLRHSRFQPTDNLKSFSKSKFLKQSHSKSHQRDELNANLSNLTLEGTEGLPTNKYLQMSNTKSDHADTFGASNGHLSDRLVTGATPLDQDKGQENTSPKPQTSQSSVKNKFHLEPSDNSFCFDFELPSSDNEEDSAATTGTSGTCNNINAKPDDAKVNTNTDHVVGPTSSQLQANINVYKYEKSNNDFTFNFGSAD